MILKSYNNDFFVKQYQCLNFDFNKIDSASTIHLIKIKDDLLI